MPLLAYLLVLLRPGISDSAAQKPDGTPLRIGDGAVTCSQGKTANAARLMRSANSVASTNIDITYYHLNLTINLAATTIDGVVRIEGTVVGSPMSVLVLDLAQAMTVASVQLSDGTPLAFSHASDALQITLPSTMSPGSSVKVDVAYSGTPISSDFGDFKFGIRSGDLFAWSLSEPYGAHEWWPCKDHPSDKADSVRVTVTVPSIYRVGSQGTLVSETTVGGNTTYDWVSHYPISSYLVSVSVGQYVRYLNTYTRPPALASLYGPLSMPLEFLVYDDGSSSLTPEWANVGDALEVFEEWFGPYPFANEKYGHCEVTFGGGMEHQTMGSLGGSTPSLVVHELAHQWYGDKISPKTWPHVWLNEGFATYGELVYWEARAATYPGVLESMLAARYSNARMAPGTLVLEDTTSINNMFNYNRVYAKGAIVLYMLRYVVGDAAFKDILKAYAADPAVRYGVATTDDFKRVAETVSGMQLDTFFSEWATDGTGYPTYKMDATWQPSVGGYTVWVSVAQTQTMPQSNLDVFEMPLIIAVQTTSGEERFRVDNNQRIQTFELTVSSEPVSVALDPDKNVLRSDAIATGIGHTPPPSSLTIQSLTPNPAGNSVAIQYRAGHAGDVRFEVYDVAGRRVLSRAVSSDASFTRFETLDTSSLAAGVYFLRVKTFAGQASRKFVIVR
jgi:aminopeptidase N